MDQVDGGAGYGQSATAGVSYPRAYRYTRGMRLFLYVFAAIMAGLGAWLVSIQVQHPVPMGWWLLLSGLALVLLGIYIAMSCTMSCLVLRADSIEIRSAFGSRTLCRNEIAGRRQQPTSGKPIQVVVPKNGRPLRLDSGYPRDSVLNAWLDALPDLDQQERQASEAKLMADPAFGANPKERLARLAKVRQLTKAVSMLSLAVVLWGYVYPHPYPWVIGLLALLPWCAVAMVGLSRGLICFDTLRNDVRPNIAVMLISPSLVLGVRALLDINLIDAMPAIEFGLIAGLPLVLVACMVGQRDQPRAWLLPMLLLPMVALPYGGGLLVLADVMLDHQPAQVFQTQVVRKYISTGKHPQPYLVLAPWGPQTTGDRVAVSRAYYAHVEVDTAVCVNLHRGAVGLRWYGVQDCAPVPKDNAIAAP